MKTVFAKTLRNGDDLFDQPFLLLEVTQRKTRDDRPYILFDLSDKTGRIGGVYWNVPDSVIESCPAGQVVLVTGNVTTYNQRLQVVAVDLQPFEPDSMADYAPSSRREENQMTSELKQIISELREPLSTLLTKILLKPLFLRRYAQAPAAKMMHHACIGGLLEHSLNVVQYCHLASKLYSDIDLDLLIAGALLHDVGKVEAYELAAAFPMTNNERLVGHIGTGLIIVDRAAREMDLPEPLLQELLHIIVASHGTREWGSPEPPRTLEAVLLSQFDLLDSRAQGFLDHVAAEPGDNEWTSRSAMFGHELKR